MLVRFLFSLWMVTACGHADPQPKPSTPRSGVSTRYGQASDRLVSMLDSGWVVSRNAEGGAEHQGDSLIWSGKALASLDCAHGDAIEPALQTMVASNDGKLQRHLTIPGVATMDGAMGLYNGIAWRIKHCPGSQESWKNELGAAPGFWENPLSADGAELPLEFTYVRDLLGYRLGFVEEPRVSRKGKLEAEIVAWTTGVVAKKAACYRIHLGLLALQTIETLGGEISRLGRDAFCGATDGLDLPTTDLWCGRHSDYLETFQYDQWEFRSQRCPAWETPDGKGFKTPGLDLITYIRNAYNLEAQ